MVTVFIFRFQAPHDESEDGNIEDEGDIAEDIIDNSNDSIDDANDDDVGDGHIAEVCDTAVEVKLS